MPAWATGPFSTPMRPINFRTLDLNLLKVFDAVMLERNVTRAAERLSMTQPAASNALRRLREATREELFLPTSSGVVPTVHAQGLWPIVRNALRNLEQAFVPQAFDAPQLNHCVLCVRTGCQPLSIAAECQRADALFHGYGLDLT